MKLPPILILMIIAGVIWPLQSEARTWSEKKFGKTFISIDRDLDRKRWHRVIKRGQKALPHCVALHSLSDTRCIILLRNINLSYSKIRRFNPNPEQIELAYTLAKAELGPSHMTTNISRDIYYNYALYKEDYAGAIPLALELLAVEETIRQDPWEILALVEQLYALYGLTEQWSKEEDQLKRLLSMTESLIGKDGEDYQAAALALAQNYCVQKKLEDFYILIKEHRLSIRCPQSNSKPPYPSANHIKRDY